MRKGLIPRQWHRDLYKPFQLTETECYYLAAMLDGEGSIHCIDTTRVMKSGIKVYKVVSVIACYNTDEGILSYVESLLGRTRRFSRKPSGAGVGTDGRGITTNKCVYAVAVTGYRPIHDILTRLLPFMHHLVKRRRAQHLLAFINSKLEAANVGHV